MTSPPDDTTTDLYAALAALRAERDAGLARETALAEALATRNSEYGERIEQQAATIDVLKVMSSSPGDAQPVFELIVERARAFCGADECTVALLDGDMLHLTALAGMSETSARNYAAQFPRPVNTASMFGRAILARQAVQTPDVSADPEHFSRTRVGGPEFRAIVAVPMLRAGTPIGAIGLGRKMPGVYSATQMELLRTFAEQAVIAITSAETYRALQTRTADLQETLEYQTATSDVLKVISRSTFDLQPVLETLVETAARLCDADQAVIAHPEGDLWRLRANFGFPPEYEAYQRERGLYSLDPHAPNVSARAVRERRPVHIHDVAEVPGYPEIFIRLAKQRSSLGVPLLREGEAIGYIVLARQRVEPFTDRQIELVSTFADQAVIAIENTRLITEQREALEQQTATAEVLQIINSSPGDLAPVFEAMLDKAIRLCEAAHGHLLTYDGECFHLVAASREPHYVEWARQVGAVRPGPSAPLGRISHGERIVHIVDLREEEVYRTSPAFREQADIRGARSQITVGLFKDNTLLGAMIVYRQEVRPFSDKQIALLENFAAQAVIAMENARLITEQREALEQQTATAEVLQVINTNPGNLTPVFDAVLERAMRLCGGTIGGIFTFDGGHSVTSAVRGVTAAFQEYNDKYPMDKIQPGTLPARIIETRGPVQNPDVTAGENYRAGHPYARALVELGGIRAVLAVPLLNDGVAVGMVAIYRQEAGAFSDKQIALLENFAAQAVIAMENARLLTEQREALEQQTATAEVLQVINASPGNLVPVFDAILEKAHSLCGVALGELELHEGGKFRAVAMRGVSGPLAELLRQPFTPPPNSPLARLLAGEPVVQIADLFELAQQRPDDRRAQAGAQYGLRTVLFVPLRKDDALLGYITAYRQEVRPFSEKEIALLQNFAAQAVIAMENTRLITEISEALEQQTATADVLQVINASPGNLAPVFEAMLEKAMRLCGAAFGSLYTYDGARFHTAAQRGVPAAFAEIRMKSPPVSPPGSPIARSYEAKRSIQVLDVMAGNDYQAGQPTIRELVDVGGVRTLLVVPLFKDETPLGHFALYRQKVLAFSGKQIALLENFAAQAVIAMENARLLNEQREALEQQTATAEVLQVINASPGNLGPVFEAMLGKAIRLCEAEFGTLRTWDGERFHLGAAHGDPELIEWTKQQRPFTPINGNLPLGRIVRGAEIVRITDALLASYQTTSGFGALAAIGIRSGIAVALRKDATLLGAITVYRKNEVRPFTDKQIALLQSFAAQAVIAMENARLLDEIRQRQEELRVTFENMGDGVAMFDETQYLAAWNRKFQDILDLPDALLEQRRTYEEHLRFLAARGDFGPGIDTVEQIEELVASTGQPYGYERTRPDGRVIEIRRNPVPDGGFVLIYSDITERKRSEEEIRAARDAAETALRELRTAQANLIQAEKMASLGQLTAGIAHEIKNPLNFVNNFAALSVDLLAELKETAAPGFAVLSAEQHAEVEDLSAMLTSNLEKITEHGKRADGIVKAMLEHSRGSSGERRMVDLNALIDEALNLAYHGARAQDQSFNITLERDFGAGIAPIEVNPQDITRVFLNLFSNGFYATTRRAREGGNAGFEPTQKVTTRDAAETVEIRVRDNGTGIPADIRDKLFQPFFTTKPTGEGTGLGLSISYDIITQQHGGNITVDSNVGEYSEFIIRLPRNP